MRRFDGLRKTPSKAPLPELKGGVRFLVLSLVFAASIPVILFAGWMAYITADRERTDARRAAFAAVQRVADQLSAELDKELEVAEALAGSIHLDKPDLPVFYKEAQRLTAARPLWETVSLATPDRLQVLNILRPLGEDLGAPYDDGSFEQVLLERKAAIGGLGPVGRLSGKRLVPLRIPVTREGVLHYVLTVGLVPSGIGGILRNAGAPDGWVGIIVDAKGDIVARTRAEGTELGRPASQALRDAVARGSEGFYGGRTLDDVEVESAFRTLAQPSGWSVHFGIPTEALHTPVLRSLYALAGGGLASFALAGGLAVLVARDIAQRRRQERRRSALELSLTEAGRDLAVDAAELGTWRLDPVRSEIAGSERMRVLFDLPRGSTGDQSETSWPLDRFFASLQPEDHDAMRSAFRHCLDADEAVDVEIQAVQRSGQIRWVRMTGRCPLSGPELPRQVHGVAADVTLRKTAEAERAHLLRNLAEAQETEQRRIARDLHDQVGQTVTGLSLGLKGLEQALVTGAPANAIQDQVHWLQGLTNEIGRDIHRAAVDLRPTAIDDFGLERALATFLQEWSRRSGISSDLQSLGRVRRLPPSVETAAYRVVQEALTNAVRHAEATSVGIVLEFRDKILRVVIEDNGKGFDPDAVGGGHLGLIGMRERLALLDGSLTVESAPGAGTSLFFQIPTE